MKITRTHEISYAHRLLKHPGKCRNLHGHNGRIELTVDVYPYSSTGMVMDFGELDIALELISNLFDHKTILEKGDPLIEVLQNEGQLVTVLDQPPTAEVLASICTDIAVNNLSSIIKASVRFWETEKCCAEVNESNRMKVLYI